MKKMFLILLAVSLFAIVAVGCAGSEVPVAGGGAVAEPVPLPDVIDDGEIVDEGSGMDFDNLLPDEEVEDFYEPLPGAFASVTGDIISIEDTGDGIIHVLIEDVQGHEAIFILNDETVFPFNDTYDVGDTVTGWRSTEGPMILPWPPQYAIVVLEVRPPTDEVVFVKVDRFTKWEDHDGDFMLSQDEQLAITFDEYTVIMTQDGDEYNDFTTEVPRNIVVFYSVATRMMPATTTASKMIVLFEGIMPLA